MKTFKFLQTSDLHFDWLFEKFTPARRRERRQEIVSAFYEIIEIALREQVEAVLIPGDLFHSPAPGQTTLAQVEKGFLRLKSANIKVFITPGNHDLYKAGSCYNYFSFPDNVYIFRDEEFTPYRLREGVTIYGLPYQEKWAQERILLMLKIEEHRGIHVGMVHGTYKGVPMGEEAYGPILPGDINRSGLNHLALGHYHNYRDCSQPKTTACYSGCPVRLSFQNLPERVVLIVEAGMDKKTTWRQETIPSRPYRQEEHNLNEKSLGQILAEVTENVNPEECFRLILKGTIPEDELFEVEEIESSLQKHYFFAEVSDELVVVPKDVEPDTVKGVFVKKIMHVLNDDRISPEKKRLYQEALRIGLAALRRGRLL